MDTYTIRENVDEKSTVFKSPLQSTLICIFLKHRCVVDSKEIKEGGKGLLFREYVGWSWDVDWSLGYDYIDSHVLNI